MLMGDHATYAFVLRSIENLMQAFTQWSMVTPKITAWSSADHRQWLGDEGFLITWRRLCGHRSPVGGEFFDSGGVTFVVGFFVRFVVFLARFFFIVRIP